MITRLSHSTLSDYGDCGEKVRLKKIVQVPSAPTFALAGGSAVHEATANLDLLDFGVSVEGPLTFEDAFEIEVSRYIETTGIPESEWRVSGKPSVQFPDKENRKWWMAKGPTFVANWRRFLHGSPYQVALTPDNDPAIEISLDGTIGGVPFKGYLDRVLEDPKGNLILFDLKTGVRQPKPKQLTTYRVILDQMYSGEWLPRWGSYFMNRSGQMTGPEDLAFYDDGSIEHEYATAWRGIEAGVFIPNTVSGWCTSCDVRKYCYAVDGELAAEAAPYVRKVK